MSSFLRHLSQRALGTAPAIQPRRPARFEPTEPSSTPVGLFDTSVHTPAARAADTPPPLPASIPPSPTPGSRPSPPAFREGSPAPTPIPVSHRPATASEFVPPLPAPPTPAPRPFAERAAASSRVSPLVPDDKSGPRPAPPPPLSSPLPPPSTLLVERVVERVRERTVEIATRESRGDPGPLPSPPAPPAFRSAPQAHLFAPAFPPPPAPLAPAPPALPVHVTIDHVEIRAVTSATPATTVHPPAVRAPVLSLAEYLKQRAAS